MSEQDDFFSPQRVDESLELLSSPERSGNAFPWQGRISPDARLVRDLQNTYGPERQSYLQALQRVENRLVAQRLRRSEDETLPVLRARRPRPLTGRKRKQRRLKNMEHRESLRFPLGRRIHLLVATLVMFALVGSLVLVLNFVYGRHLGLAGSTPPLQSPIGKVLYTTPGNMNGFNSLAFSPDSQRIVSTGGDGLVRIWDATTGKHLVTVSWEASGFMAIWSPDGRFVAIATANGLTIANGQTGAIIHSSPYPTFGMNISGGGSSLSQRIQNSGGVGVEGIVWSPDGRFIAVSMRTGGESGYVQVLNAQTYAPAYQLQVDGAYGPGTLAWSTDGQYLAASLSGPDASGTRIEAWNIATRQKVFETAGVSSVTSQSGINNPLAFQSGGPSRTGGSLAFQPGTDNITFTVLQPDSIQVWNVANGKQVKNYRLAGNGTLAWSPDGRYLAYVNTLLTNQVNILDTYSGRNVFTYKGEDAAQIITALAWSPNGKYIATGEGLGVANVWTAE